MTMIHWIKRRNMTAEKYEEPKSAQHNEQDFSQWDKLGDETPFNNVPTWTEASYREAYKQDFGEEPFMLDREGFASQEEYDEYINNKGKIFQEGKEEAERHREFSETLANMPREPRREYSNIDFSSLPPIPETKIEHSDFHKKAYEKASVSTGTLADIQEIIRPKRTTEAFDPEEATYDVKAFQGRAIQDLNENPTNIATMKLALIAPRQLFLENYSDTPEEQYGALNDRINKLYETAGRERKHTDNMYDLEPVGALENLLNRVSGLDDERLKNVLSESHNIIKDIFRRFSDESADTGINLTTYNSIRNSFSGQLEDILPINDILQMKYLTDQSDKAIGRKNANR